jgi:hypothetical protein
MITNANWAPSHKLTFPWRLRVHSGENLLTLVAEMEKFYLENTPSENFMQSKLDKIRTYSEKLSHVISIGLHPSGKVPLWEEIAATAAAVENLWLTLTEEPHAGGYWTSGNGTGSDQMKAFTGLEKDDLQLGFFFLGYVEEKRYEAAREGLSGATATMPEPPADKQSQVEPG